MGFASLWRRGGGAGSARGLFQWGPYCKQGGLLCVCCKTICDSNKCRAGISLFYLKNPDGPRSGKLLHESAWSFFVG